MITALALREQHLDRYASQVPHGAAIGEVVQAIAAAAVGLAAVIGNGSLNHGDQQMDIDVFADDINFQRLPTVDTSNPFIARWILTPDESMMVIRLRNPRGINFPYLLSMIPKRFMSRANSIVIHGSKLDLAMQLILTPLILLQPMERKRRTV